MPTIRLTAIVLAFGSTVSVEAAKIPKLLWPTDGGHVSLGFGADWDYDGCDGHPQRHAGIDISAPRGTPVYAAANGVVLVVGGVAAGEGLQWIVLGHVDAARRSYTTVYWHIVPRVAVGQTVRRGRQIATVEGFGGNEHVHFGVRNAPFAPTSSSLALPRSELCPVPKFPEAFVNPLLVMKAPKD